MAENEMPLEPIARPSPAKHTLESAQDPVRARLEARRAGRDGGGPLDLKGLRLADEDLSGCDLSGCDLSGCDLSRANLKRANLFRAKLVGATLIEAKLGGAELSGSDLHGASLQRADLHKAGLGLANLQRASLFEADLTGATLTQANLRDIDGRRMRMHEGHARGVDLRGADLSRSDLRGSDLGDCCISGAHFNGADLRGVHLRGVTGFREAQWVGADAREIDFAGAYLCRRFIMDQNYLEEFRRQSRWTQLLYRAWWITSDCGRSLMRWSICTALIVLVFAGLYNFVAVDYGEHPTALSSLYFSVVTLTTLGYGDVAPASTPAQVVAMTEVILGYLMLGGILSIMSNKMARRAE